MFAHYVRIVIVFAIGKINILLLLGCSKLNDAEMLQSLLVATASCNRPRLRTGCSNNHFPLRFASESTLKFCLLLAAVRDLPDIGIFASVASNVTTTFPTHVPVCGVPEALVLYSLFCSLHISQYPYFISFAKSPSVS